MAFSPDPPFVTSLHPGPQTCVCVRVCECAYTGARRGAKAARTAGLAPSLICSRLITIKPFSFCFPFGLLFSFSLRSPSSFSPTLFLPDSRRHFSVTADRREDYAGQTDRSRDKRARKPEVHLRVRETASKLLPPVFRPHNPSTFCTTSALANRRVVKRREGTVCEDRREFPLLTSQLSTRPTVHACTRSLHLNRNAAVALNLSKDDKTKLFS